MFKNKLKAFERQVMALDEDKHNLIQDFSSKNTDKSKSQTTQSEGLKEYNYGPRG